MTMSFSELVKARYSVRKYDPRPIEQEKLQLILEAGLYAPSAGGGQSTKIAAIQNRTHRIM